MKQLTDAELISVVAAFVAAHGYAPDPVDVAAFARRPVRTIRKRLYSLVLAHQLLRTHGGYCPVDGPYPLHVP